MLPTVSDPDREKTEGKSWCMDFMNVLLQIDPRNLEKAQYFTHTSPGDNFSKMYDKNWDARVAAKRKNDPKNVLWSSPTFHLPTEKDIYHAYPGTR